jgi:predicted DCC family thiol-disulfide oxidoreductase YuxK
MTETTLPDGEPPVTVYFDGSCPLCRAEISHYQAQDCASSLRFCDVSRAAGEVSPGLTAEQAMARFHVRRADGEVVSGAAAFVAVWRLLPRWRWAARMASLPGAMSFLEAGYRIWLRLRPAAVKRFKQDRS